MKRIRLDFTHGSTVYQHNSMSLTHMVSTATLLLIARNLYAKHWYKDVHTNDGGVVSYRDGTIDYIDMWV